MNPKFWGMVSLAMRAGKLAVGEDKATQVVRAGKACLLILAEDAGYNTEKKVTDMAAFRHISVLRPADRVRIGQAIGKKFAVVLAVTDAGFAHQLSLLFSQKTESDE